jgi:hypothetical protein
MLRGGDAQNATWVSKRENGILYSFDISRSMFCRGNISEKLRIAKAGRLGKIGFKKNYPQMAWWKILKLFDLHGNNFDLRGTT